MLFLFSSCPYYLLWWTQNAIKFPFQFLPRGLQFLNLFHSSWLHSLKPIFIDCPFCSSHYCQNTALTKTQCLLLRNVKTRGDLENWAISILCRRTPYVGQCRAVIGTHERVAERSQRLNHGKRLFLPTSSHPADLEWGCSDVVSLWNFNKNIISSLILSFISPGRPGNLCRERSCGMRAKSQCSWENLKSYD